MLYIFRPLLLLIHIDLLDIDQETVLNWFGIEGPTTREAIVGDYDFTSTIESSTDLSLNTISLIVQSLWDKIQDGLTLGDIESTLFFILFVRFVILALRYNLKTSFYITCIGLFAGYLWYRHFIDLIFTYRSILGKLPFLHKLGMDAIQLSSMNRYMVLTDMKLGENTHWYNPGQIIYYSIIKAVVNVDPETGRKYYIDPLSMIISKLQNSNSSIVSLYYTLYNQVIPKVFEVCSKFWTQLSGIAAYAVITRIGKRYCPYLIRWHWTFLLMITLIEQIFISFIYRVYHFQTYVLIPQLSSYSIIDPKIQTQIQFLNLVINFVVLTHVGFIILGLFHAIWGQYFYFPFLVENTELHIGPRPKNSIYSGGATAWQDSEEKEKNLNRVFPKLWYGWFGKGTNHSWRFTSQFQKFVKRMIKKLKKQFRR